MPFACVLPEAPEGFCVQTTVISAGTAVGNAALAKMAHVEEEHPRCHRWSITDPRAHEAKTLPLRIFAE